MTPLGLILLDGVYDPATVALISAMSVKPNPTRTALIDSTVRALKVAGLWNSMGLLYVLASHDSQAALLNWVSPGTATLTAVSSPTFTTDRGYAGDGAASYLDSLVGINAIPTLSQDSAHYGAWGTTATANAIVGTSLTNVASIGISASRSVRVNSTTGITTAGDPTTGHVVGVRRSSSAIFSYRNGGTEITGASTSASLTTATFAVDKQNGTFSTGQVAAAHAGNQLSAADVANLYSIFRTYMTAVGVP